MYQVSIFNNSVETIIHTPDPDKDENHLLTSSMKESLSQAEQLSFSIPFDNTGYSLIEGLRTKVKIYDTRDNSVVFSGRVIPTKDGMSSEGKFIKDVTCEGALSYLIDTNTRRWSFENKTPSQVLQYLLDQHNSKVDNSRKIYLGIIEVTQPITVDTNYETTLNAIISKIKNILGGDIRVQERNGTLYLDYLKAQGTNNEVPIRLGYNLKEIVREYDPMDIITRGIPLGYGEGINQLDITSVNSGVEYIEDADSVSKYGVIEGLITNKDIQDANTLLVYGQTVLNEKKQPRFTYQQSALDLSVLPGHQNESYDLGDTLHTIVDILNIDVYSRVIERERDLILSPWSPTLTISTRPARLTDQTVDLRQRNQTLENAPQGSTCIFALSKAENVDASNPITFDLDIPKETLNINRVYLNVHGRRYRANSKDSGSGGGTTATSSSGGGVTATSSSGGGVTATSSSGGGVTATSSAGGSTTATSSSGGSTTVTSGNTTNWGGGWSYNLSSGEYELVAPVRSDSYGSDAYVPRSGLAHTHNVSIGNHYHNVSVGSHDHDVSIPDHTHTVGVPDHSHSVSIGDHSHTITIQDHIHSAIYGIVESTYPKDVNIKVNGNIIPNLTLGDGNNAFDEYNIDITSYVGTGNNKIEITTSQNGRIDSIVYSQIFIQAK